MTFSIVFQIQLFVLVIFNECGRLVSVCPSACHQIACTTGVLSCPDGGLDRIPSTLPPGTSKILLTNHNFFSPNLQYSNLSSYGPPQFKIIKITIQNCGLVGISSNTFSHLTELSILDLANNKLAELVPDTFTSLTLNFLRLDGNINISLHSHSFRGLILSTLSLINCGLKYLPFETINEMSGSLKKLYLTNNKMQTIDRQFKDIFEQLTVLQINENPINCTCEIQWLGSVLLWRRKQYNAIQTYGVLSEAMCKGPSNNRNRLLISLSSKDYNCQLPQLKLVDVYMTSHISARLTCASERELSGNPTVQWLSKTNDKLVFESQAQDSAALLVTSRSKIDFFLCVISNVNGNVTVLVRIQWPGLVSNRSSQHDTIANIITSVSLYNSTSIGSYLHAKRFTLLEMIGGVVGTFGLTMILFICIYRCMVVSWRKEHKKKWYIAYEPTAASDSQTYDVPHYTMGSYYGAQIFSNHKGPGRYIDLNNNHSKSVAL